MVNKFLFYFIYFFYLGTWKISFIIRSFRRICKILPHNPWNKIFGKFYYISPIHLREKSTKPLFSFLVFVYPFLIEFIYNFWVLFIHFSNICLCSFLYYERQNEISFFFFISSDFFVHRKFPFFFSLYSMILLQKATFNNFVDKTRNKIIKKVVFYSFL